MLSSVDGETIGHHEAKDRQDSASRVRLRLQEIYKLSLESSANADNRCAARSNESALSAEFCRQCGSKLTAASNQTLKTSVPPNSLSASLPSSFKDGQYVVQERLGEGGSKTVYRVHDTVLDRDVAFALIKSEGLEEEDRLRVVREAQTMAKLGDHPNIVQIYEFGEEDGRPYMVQPLLSGGTIESLTIKAESDMISLMLCITTQILNSSSAIRLFLIQTATPKSSQQRFCGIRL